MKINLKKFKKIKDRKKTIVKRKTNITPIPPIPIRVLYKKVGQVPEVKIINNVSKLKKSIIKNNLDIIPYETVYIICHNKKLMEYMKPNIFLSLKRIAGDFILIDIDKNKHEFKSLTQENIIWYTKDLINKAPINTLKKVNIPKINNIQDIYERGFEDNRNTKSNKFENTLINVLNNLELVLAMILKNINSKK